MKWREDNPLGLALFSIGAGLVLVSLLLAWLWNRPVSTDTEGAGAEQAGIQSIPADAYELGPVSDYKVVNDRPVFNESRRPVVLIADEEAGIDMSELTIAGAPEVRLTGVIITPEVKVATLSPSKEGKAIIAHEGESLEGEYVGWTLSSVKPRQVSLESRDGQTMQLELAVHDRVIEEPPKPEPVARSAAGEDSGADTASASDQPLSRAEEIRQRIQERREQLRREAEEDQDRDPEAAKAAQRSSYQQAIQEMMRKRDNDDKEEDGNESD